MTKEQKAEIIRLTKAHRPFSEIGVKLGLTTEMVQSYARSQNLIQLVSQNFTNGCLKKMEIASSDEGCFKAAIEALNWYRERYVEKHGGMWLDGKPARVGDVIKAANEAIARSGRGEQLGKNKDWHAKKVVDVVSEA